MQINVDTVSEVKKKISVEIPVDLVNAEIEKVYADIQKKAKLQGFRPGKAPLSVVRHHYADAMREEVVRRMYDQTLFQALKKYDIEPIDIPSINYDELEFGSPFKYVALVEVLPTILLKDYTGLQLKREKFIFNPDAVEKEIERMRDNMASLVPVNDDTFVENGHLVTLDYTFSVPDHPEEDSHAEDAQVEVGSKRLLAGFEESLLGLKKGDEKDIRVVLPEGYRNPDVAGKECIFSVTLKEIKRKELPELDDDFAQQYGEYDTMEELRSKLGEYRQKHETDRIANEFKERAIKALIDNNPIEAPDSMVRKQLEHMLENFKNRLKSQRLTLEAMGLDESGFMARFRDDAVEKVKGGLLLMSLVEKENIAVTDEDIEKRFEEIAAGNPDMFTRVREYYTGNRKAKNSLMAEIREDKALQFLLDNAIITDVDAAELNQPQEM